MIGYYVALGAFILFFWLKKTRKSAIELPPLRRDVCLQTDLIMRTLPDSPLSVMSMEESGDEMLIETFFDPDTKRD